MARVKNAKTKYEISAKGSEEFMVIGKWISTVTDSSEDEVEESAYYDGDGTKQNTVIGFKEAYDFEGTFDSEDKASAFIRDLRGKDGDERVVQFKVTDPDGTVEVGPATVTNILFRGGEASEYPSLSYTISRNEKAKVTKGSPSAGSH